MKSMMMALAVIALAPLTARAGGHAPILIQSDSDFAACECVSSGNGTAASPYVIGPLAINSAPEYGVYIDGTNLSKSFVLYNLTVAGNGAATAYGIELVNINSKNQAIIARVAGKQTSIQTNDVGILVRNSKGVVLDGGGANHKGPGVGNTGAGTVNKNATGAIDVENSSNITITGWQMSTNGPSVAPDWISLDPGIQYWAVGGVRFFGVIGSTIDHNSANNCTNVSYSIFFSSYNTISNNTADYPYTMNYLVTDGSAHNTIEHNEGGTGDFIGLMVADPLPGQPTLAQYGPTHDNLIAYNAIHSDGPTGNELNPISIVPAFLGGIVVLNGTYANQIINNNTWASTGADLVWAQAVPDSTTPIGIKTYPPLLHCNVSASEGGGGVSNLNGNTWSGNTFKVIDSCLPPQ